MPLARAPVASIDLVGLDPVCDKAVSSELRGGGEVPSRPPILACCPFALLRFCRGGFPHRSLPKLILNLLYSSRPRTASMALMALAMLVKLTKAQLFSRRVLTNSISPYSEKSCLSRSSVHVSSRLPMYTLREAPPLTARAIAGGRAPECLPQP